MSAPRKRKPPDESSGGRESQSRPGEGAQDQEYQDPRQLQGIATARHADQAELSWPRPAGADGLDALERAWGRR